MNDRFSLFILPILAMTVAACRAGSSSSEGVASATAPSAPASANASSAPQPPQQALDALDSRSPVPLLAMMANHQKQNMRDHLAVVQEVVAAIAENDFAAIEKAVGRMGFSAQMGAMCTHMGAGAPGFAEEAIAFHKTADAITEAARRRDRDGVARALATTLTTCTGCHSRWKQHVVDEEAWARTTGSVAPMTHAP